LQSLLVLAALLVVELMVVVLLVVVLMVTHGHPAVFVCHWLPLPPPAEKTLDQIHSVSPNPTQSAAGDHEPQPPLPP
jgi:hypothetical protein